MAARRAGVWDGTWDFVDDGFVHLFAWGLVYSDVRTDLKSRADGSPNSSFLKIFFRSRFTSR